jgi:hypothetical protein
MMRLNYRRKIYIGLIIILILSMLSSTVLADVNYGGGDYGGSTGKGTVKWKYTTAGRGVRISIYFVEGGKENFADPDSQIFPIGNPTDFAKHEVDYSVYPDYVVDVYSGMSVFDYMNRGGKEYSSKSASIEPYHYISSSDPVSKSMPDILYSERSDWEEWFTGNDYENIPKVSKLCGHEISAEDFKNGIYNHKGLVLTGTYEIFFEPLVSAVVDDKGMFLSLRDAIRYNEFYADKKQKKPNEVDYYDGKIVDWLNRMFVFLANRAYLVSEELAPLNMKPNLYDGRPYLVHHDVATKERDRAEIKQEMKPGGKIYDSMGVGTVCVEADPPAEGTITSEPEEAPELPEPAEPKQVTGVLKAEDRGNEKFDVALGIPATEELYAQVKAEEYLHELACRAVTGTKTETFSVKKTYYKTWQDPDYYVDCPNCDNGRAADAEEPEGWSECPEPGCHGGQVEVSGSWHVNVPETVTQEYTVSRNYMYWVIDRFALYELEGAGINNDVLEGGGVDIDIDPGSYIGPEIVEFIHSDNPLDHIIIDPFEEALTYDASEGKKVLWLPSEAYYGSDVPNSVNLSAQVNAAIGQFKVRNDSLVINFRKRSTSGNIIDNKVTIVQGEYIPGPGDNTEAERRNHGSGPVPGGIPESPYTKDNALYEKDLVVVRETPNGTYETTGHVSYRRLSPSLDPAMDEVVEVEIEDLNPITVHTPVVCNSGVRNEYARSQQLGEREEGRAELILGRAGLIKFQAKDHMHRDIKGYGDSDYTKYVKEKYVRFPFDIYIKDISDEWVFVPKNSWHAVDKSQEFVDIGVPVWVDEGNYTVNFKTVAINAPGDIDDPGDAGFNKAPGDTGSRQEYMANKDMDNYVAYRDSKVRVVGRVENFRITDINDYPLWETVFRTKAGSSSHTGRSYPVGSASSVYKLPIMDGSHPTQGDRGVLKTGYAFKFTLDTVGEYFADVDHIRIIPTFYYVGKNGGSGKPVDIYYNEYFTGRENILVKIGSDKDRTNRQVIVNTDIYRNMPEADIKRTCELRGISDRQFRGRKVDIGTYDEIVLTKDLRLFTGNTVSHPFAKGSAEEKRVWKSVQRWYGEYKLPDKLYVAPAGLDIANHAESRDGINGKESFWLKDGYIIVNFRIETYHADDAGKINGPVLGYWHGSYNRWEDEGFEYVQKDSHGKTFQLDSGDVVFYHANKKSSDDYKVGGNR